MHMVVQAACFALQKWQKMGWGVYKKEVMEDMYIRIFENCLLDRAPVLTPARLNTAGRPSLEVLAVVPEVVSADNMSGWKHQMLVLDHTS
jgi:hypothetical protein